MNSQAHVACQEETCDCRWCGQFITAGDWLYEGAYCSAACVENDATPRPDEEYFQ